MFFSKGGAEWIVAFLGNPGLKYNGTRHNAGFMAADAMEKKLGVSINKMRFKALTQTADIGGKKVLLMKPQTYMNLSGDCVQRVLHFFKTPPENLIVMYDDIDLPVGALRIRASGSAGTHNGMRSVIGLLGRQDFPRLRVGVGKKPEGWELADWVLSHYQTEADRKTQFDAFLRAADVVDDLMKNGLESAMRMANAPA